MSRALASRIGSGCDAESTLTYALDAWTRRLGMYSPGTNQRKHAARKVRALQAELDALRESRKGRPV